MEATCTKAACDRECDEPSARDPDGKPICRIHLREQNFAKCSDCGTAFHETDHGFDVHTHPDHPTQALCEDCWHEAAQRIYRQARPT